MIYIKNYLFIFFCFLNFILLSQEKINILESYIKEKSVNNISSLVLPIENLENALNIYLEDDTGIFNEDENTFELINRNFDFRNINYSQEKYHQFSFLSSKREWKKQRFSEPIISINGDYAIFYTEEKCRKGLCGGGSLILMEKNFNIWIVKRILYAWIG